MNYRVYYNRRSEYPFIWSVDQGEQDTEINVRDIEMHKVNRVMSCFDGSVPRGSFDKPCVWFAVSHATLTVKDGVAHFFHDPDWREPSLANTI